MEGSVSKVKQMETFPLPREKISLFDSEMMMMARRVQHDVAVTRRERHFSNNFQVRLEGQDGGRAITHTHRHKAAKVIDASAKEMKRK